MFADYIEILFLLCFILRNNLKIIRKNKKFVKEILKETNVY